MPRACHSRRKKWICRCYKIRHRRHTYICYCRKRRRRRRHKRK